jgi:hypothetical protein
MEWDTHVHTTGKEAHDGKCGVQHAARDVDELHILRTTGTKTTDSTENTHRAKRDETNENDLRPWRVVCVVLVDDEML